jgi:hypothetical protein
MLVEAGIIPKNAVQQMVGWKIMTEEEASKLGAKPVSLDSDKKAAEKFTKKLGEEIERDDREIRETELTPMRGCQAIARSGDSQLLYKGGAHIDTLGRVHLPVSNNIHMVASIRLNLTGSPDGWSEEFEVTSTEPRFQGDEQIALVAHLVRKE